MSERGDKLGREGRDMSRPYKRPEAQHGVWRCSGCGARCAGPLLWAMLDLRQAHAQCAACGGWCLFVLMAAKQTGRKAA